MRDNALWQCCYLLMSHEMDFTFQNLAGFDCVGFQFSPPPPSNDMMIAQWEDLFRNVGSEPQDDLVYPKLTKLFLSEAREG
jgi:hypothetical protein